MRSIRNGAVLAVAATAAQSVALAGFGLDSLVEIAASTVVLWELADGPVDSGDPDLAPAGGARSRPRRERRALAMIGVAWVVLVTYLAGQGALALAVGHHARHRVLGIGWMAATAVVMLALAAGKAHVGRELDDAVLRTEGRVTLVDGILAMSVLAALLLDASLGWWWADPVSGLVVAAYGAREAAHCFAVLSAGDRAA